MKNPSRQPRGPYIYIYIYTHTSACQSNEKTANRLVGVEENRRIRQLRKLRMRGVDNDFGGKDKHQKDKTMDKEDGKDDPGASKHVDVNNRSGIKPGQTAPWPIYIYIYIYYRYIGKYINASTLVIYIYIYYIHDL